jgi:hypothetical protein
MTSNYLTLDIRRLIMKLFSVEEANALLPTVRPILRALQHSHQRVRRFAAGAQHAAEGAKLGGGGMADGSRYLATLLNLTERIGELEALGIQLKDIERGLIDFPSLREGRVVLLCWYLGEGDQIAYWHETDAGFAGRQPLYDSPNK